jgi:fibronectin-binding autotransporter adhesin
MLKNHAHRSIVALMNHLFLVITISTFILGSGMANAQTYTWTGATSTWESAANWGGAGFPQNASDAGNFGPTGNTTPTISSAITVGNLTFGTGAQQYTVGISAGSLTLSGTGIVNNSFVAQNFSVSSGAALTFSGTSTVSGSPVAINNSGTVTFLGTSHTNFTAAISGAGTLVQGGTGTTVLTGTSTYSGNTAVKSGALVVDGSGAITATSTFTVGDVLGDNGAVTIQNGGRVHSGDAYIGMEPAALAR